MTPRYVGGYHSSGKVPIPFGQPPGSVPTRVRNPQQSPNATAQSRVDHIQQQRTKYTDVGGKMYQAKQISNHSTSRSCPQRSGKGRQNDVQLFYSTFCEEISAVGAPSSTSGGEERVVHKKGRGKEVVALFTNKNSLSILPVYLCHILEYMVIS